MRMRQLVEGKSPSNDLGVGGDKLLQCCGKMVVYSKLEEEPTTGSYLSVHFLKRNIDRLYLLF